MSDTHTPPAARPVISRSTWLLAAVGLACMLLLANRAIAERRSTGPDGGNLLLDHGTVAGTDTAPSQAPTAERALGVSRVLDLSGRKVPLLIKGEPTIIMISSRTCSWCKRALKDLGEMSAGRPLPRITLLTLESAADGVPMVESEQITGARLVGPASATERSLITGRFPGTPTFVEVDSNGRVVRTLPGYPIRDELKHWLEKMEIQS